MRDFLCKQVPSHFTLFTNSLFSPSLKATMKVLLWFFCGLVFPYALAVIPFDVKIIHDVLKHFHIGRCIILSERLLAPETVKNVKYLTERNILTVVMNLADLNRYFFQNQGPLPSHKEAVVGGLHAIAASNIFYQAYRPPQVINFFWLVFPTGAEEALALLKVPYNCEFLIAYKEDPSDEKIGLFEFYDLRGVNELLEFGSWSERTGLFVKNAGVSFYKRRYDFKGNSLIMLRLQENGYAYESEHANVQLWLAMGEMMNFTTRMITLETKLREYLIADVGSETTAFHASVYNLYARPMIAPIWRTRMFMYVRHEVDETSLWAAYLRPLSRMVWLSLSCTLVAASICLIIIAYQVPRRIIPVPAIEFGFTPIDTMCNQGGTRIGSRVSKRIAVACMRMLALAVMHAYAGVIISTLTFQYPSYPFNDLAGFSESGQYIMGSVNNTFGVGYFQYSSDPVAKRIATALFERMDKLPSSKLEGLRRCCTGKYAFIGDENIFHDVDQRSIPCRILRIPTAAFVTYTGMELYQFSEYSRVFFYNLLSFYSSGILKKLGSKDQVTVLEREDYEQVEFSKVHSLLALLSIGILISCAVLSIENFIYSKKHGSSRNQNRRIVMYDGLWRYIPSE